MADPLTREQYHALSAEDRMAARLESLRTALGERRAPSLRRRGVADRGADAPVGTMAVAQPALGGEWSEQQRREAIAEAGREAQEAAVRSILEQGSGATPGMRVPTEVFGEVEVTITVDPARAREAAGKSGITQEQAHRFLRGLAGRTDG